MTVDTKEDCKAKLDMPLLPKGLWNLRAIKGENAVAAGIYRHPSGVMYWIKVHPSDFPKYDISVEDLKRFNITLGVDGGDDLPI